MRSSHIHTYILTRVLSTSEKLGLPMNTEKASVPTKVRVGSEVFNATASAKRFAWISGCGFRLSAEVLPPDTVLGGENPSQIDIKLTQK